MTTEPREASWSAPVLWRFGRATEFNAKAQGKPKFFCVFASLRYHLTVEIKGNGRDAENGNRDGRAPQQ
jgi:hypothetical protein